MLLTLALVKTQINGLGRDPESIQVLVPIIHCLQQLSRKICGSTLIQTEVSISTATAAAADGSVDSRAGSCNQLLATEEARRLRQWKERMAAKRSQNLPAHHAALVQGDKRKNVSPVSDHAGASLCETNRDSSSSEEPSPQEQEARRLQEWKERMAAKRAQNIPTHHAALVQGDKRKNVSQLSGAATLDTDVLMVEQRSPSPPSEDIEASHPSDDAAEELTEEQRRLLEWKQKMSEKRVAGPTASHHAQLRQQDKKSYRLKFSTHVPDKSPERSQSPTKIENAADGESKADKEVSSRNIATQGSRSQSPKNKASSLKGSFLRKASMPFMNQLREKGEIVQNAAKFRSRKKSSGSKKVSITSKLKDKVTSSSSTSSRRRSVSLDLAMETEATKSQELAEQLALIKKEVALVLQDAQTSSNAVTRKRSYSDAGVEHNGDSVEDTVESPPDYQVADDE